MSILNPTKPIHIRNEYVCRLIIFLSKHLIDTHSILDNLPRVLFLKENCLIGFRPFQLIYSFNHNANQLKMKTNLD